MGSMTISGAVQKQVIPPVSGTAKTPANVVLTAAGCTNGTCSDCSNFNGTRTLPYRGGAAWAAPGPTLCGNPTTASFTNGGSGTVWTLNFSGAVMYAIALGSTWDGVSDLSLTRIGAPTTCNFPNSVTIHPLYT